MRKSRAEHIIGKYKVIDYSKPYQPSVIMTDNPREAMYEANKNANRVIENICGEREFYQEDSGRWRICKGAE